MREKFKDKLTEVKKLMGTLNEFHGKITMFWSAESQRILGHVLRAPPGTGGKRFTEDWALAARREDRLQGQCNLSRYVSIYLTKVI